MRKLSIVTLILLSCVCYSGCIMFYDYTALPSGHYWPKREQWTILPDTSKVNSNSPLDFGAVYIRKSSDEWCHVYRFWPSGRVIFKNMPYPPTLTSVDDLGGWSVLGYYKIDAGKLILETYGPAGSPATKGGYSKRSFTLENQSLVQLSGTFNGHDYKDFTKYDMKYRQYVKYPIEGMKIEPFW